MFQDAAAAIVSRGDAAAGVRAAAERVGISRATPPEAAFPDPLPDPVTVKVEPDAAALHASTPRPHPAEQTLPVQVPVKVSHVINIFL